jgi:hypothetical protein
VQPVEGVEIGRIASFGNPDAAAVRVYGIPDGYPFIYTQQPVGPKEDDGTAVYAQVGGVLGVAGQERTQGLNPVLVIGKEGAAYFKINGRFEPAAEATFNRVLKLDSVWLLAVCGPYQLCTKASMPALRAWLTWRWITPASVEK